MYNLTGIYVKKIYNKLIFNVIIQYIDFVCAVGTPESCSEGRKSFLRRGTFRRKIEVVPFYRTVE